MPPSDDTATRTPRVPLGPVGRYVVENLKQLREARRLTYQELSDRLKELGRPIPPLGLSRIEKEVRRVDADDLVALALTLGVSPAALLLPRDGGPDDEIELLPGQRFPARDVWAWADGSTPLPVPAGPGLALADFENHARPAWLHRGVIRDADLPAMRQQAEETLRRLDLIESALTATRADRERER